MEKLLLTCDLDRTVLPNGAEPASPEAAELFRKFVSQDHVILAYASGRDIGLIKDAIKEYDIPIPDVAVGDVGTSMYFYENGEFRPHRGWDEEIASDWNGYTGPDIHKLLQNIPELSPQEPEKQNTFKQSYYLPYDSKKTDIVPKVSEILEEKSIKAAVIFSIDEAEKTGLLDILPASATKKHALEYLHKYFNLSKEQIVYAGDSGNDIDPLTSGYQAILVANARPEVREEVESICSQKGLLEQIYFAKGNFQNLNGNYAAGILEGLAHFGKYN